MRHNAAWNLVGNVSYAAAQWLQVVILARLGTPEQLGDFAYAAAVCTPVFMFSNLQLRSAQVSDASGRFEFREYMGVRIATSAAALALIAAGTALFCRASPWAPVVIVIAVAKAIESVSDVFQGYLQRRQRMDLAGKSLLLKSVLTVGFGFAAQALTRSVVALALAIAACQLLTLLFYDVWAAESLGRISCRFETTRASFHRLRRLMLRCLPLGIAMSLISLQTSAPRLALGRFHGASAVGGFAAIVYLASVGGTMVTALGTAAAPKLSDYAAIADKRQFNGLLLRVTAAAIAIGAGGVAAAYLFGPALLALFYGVGYAKYSTAFLICTIGSTFWLVTSALGFAATAQGRFGVQPAAMILTLVVLAAGLFALVPRFGVNGASIATAVSAMAGMAAYLAIVVRNENDKPRIPR